MPILVDTWNVLHVVGVLPPDLAGLDLHGLIGLIRGSRYRQERTRLICDGVPGPELTTDRHGGVRVEHTGARASADDVIIAAIRRSSAPRRLIVVSSDRSILREARRRRCRTLTSESFLGHLAEDHVPPSRNAPPAPKAKQPRRTKTPVLPADVLGEAVALEQEARAAAERERADRDERIDKHWWLKLC